MFEQLFKYPAVLSRHRDAPLASARASYLVHRQKDGTSLATLRRIARELLVIVGEMDLQPTTIEIAAEYEVQLAQKRYEQGGSGEPLGGVNPRAWLRQSTLSNGRDDRFAPSGCLKRLSISYLASVGALCSKLPWEYPGTVSHRC